MEKVFIKTEQFRDICSFLYKLGYSWDQDTKKNPDVEDSIVRHCSCQYMGIFLDSINMHLSYTLQYEYFKAREATEITVADIIMRVQPYKKLDIASIEGDPVIILKVLDNETFIAMTKDAFIVKMYWDKVNSKWVDDAEYIDVYSALRLIASHN